MTMEGGPFQEYFYIEIPVSVVPSGTVSGAVTGLATKTKRFVYVHDDPSFRFPMHFGVEVAALIIDKPEKANWKNCVVSENEEETLSEKFKGVFEKFDFTTN